MDAARMIYLAQNWTLVANQHQYNVPSTKETIRLTRDGSTTIGVTVDKNAMTVNNRVDHLEHVLATVNITSKKRGDMEVHLVSPSGTISNVMTKRPLDTSDKGFYMWDFMSVHFWGEDPHGRWLLKVKHSGKFFSTVVIHYFSLTLYGTAENPLSEDGLPIDNSRVISRNVLSTITTSEKRLSKKVHLLPRNTSGLLEDSDSVLHNSSAFENKTLETSVDQTETTAYKSGPHFLMTTTLATPKSSPKINTHLNSKNNSILNRSFFDLFKNRALGSPRKKPDTIFQTTEPSKLRIKSNRNPKKRLPKIRSGKDRFDEVMGVSRSTLVNFLNKYTKRKHTLKRYYKCVKHPTYCRYFAYKPKKEEAVKLSSPVREYVLKDPAFGYATQSESREGKLIRKKLKRKYILEMMKRFTIYCHFLRNHDNHRLHFSSDRHIPVEQVRPYRYFI
ncbi:furin-like protease 1, isoforms 1/1-X/2 [Limulus polyphemus]|uniref:Furin-like protease 1, isoforms 1/1-X/2 n=1 Tax=Limulus polyphemus TaxID=6850 RepID=A0ABM1C3T7_LIMPO|nr:furin-like protease 1, isoforms 1/1-X/2 [Limulus polyphemus]